MSGWLGVATEVWTGFGGALLGAVVGGWIALRSAAKERLLNRVTRLVELYGELGHQVIDVDVVLGEVYAALAEQDAARTERRQPRLQTPESLQLKVERQFHQYMATFRLIAANETDATRTVSLEAMSRHLLGEFNFLKHRHYEQALREQLSRGHYHTQLRNSVLEMMHHLPQIPRLGFWGKMRWEDAQHARLEEVKRLEAFTASVVEKRIEEERKAAAAQAQSRT